MQQIELTKETIEAITKYISSTEIEGYCTQVKEAEFEQDGILIFIDYEVWATYHEERMIHTEVPYLNEENLSYWELEHIDINSIKAYNEDGKEIPVSDKDFKTVEKQVAA